MTDLPSGATPGHSLREIGTAGARDRHSRRARSAQPAREDTGAPRPLDRPALRRAIRAAASRLGEAGVASPATDARLMAEHLIGCSLLMAGGADEDFPDRYDALVSRRAAREPLQHVLGVMWFRGLELSARPGVFIVRPETEVVAGAAIKAVQGLLASRGVPGEQEASTPLGPRQGSAGPVRTAVGLAPPSAAMAGPTRLGAEEDDGAAARPVVVDLCTGSGAIAAAVAVEVPTAQVSAVELDAGALDLATQNLARLASSVHLIAGDATAALDGLEAPPDLAALAGACDVVVSNPPYVPAGAIEDIETGQHDPDLALYGGGEDGLTVPRAIVARAAELLAPGGVLVMEHDPSQSAELRKAATAVGFREAATGQDLTGRDRYLRAVR